MEHSGISDRTEIYPGIRDRLEALVLLAETRLERIEKQQAEIKRLENANQDLVDERDIFARTLDKRDAEIERLRDELRERLSQDILDDALEEWKKENERLREENALLTKGWQPATPTALLDEIERLRGLLSDALPYFGVRTVAHGLQVPHPLGVRIREALGYD